MDLQNKKSAANILKENGLLGKNDLSHLDVQSNEDEEKWQKSREEAEHIWDGLDSNRLSVSGTSKGSNDILFNEALQYYQTRQLDKSNICPKISRSKFARIIRYVIGPPRLDKSLRDERDLLFCIAQGSINDEEEVHSRVLQTIYKRLTGVKHNCPRMGHHWEDIGFQGKDPATDLRGAGFLSLLHLLLFVTDHKSIADKVYKLSLHHEQNFPFALVSINVTKIALQVLRQEQLTRICNKRKQVVATVNDFYLALMWHIYQIWKSQHKTMKDSGHVIKDATNTALKHPTMLLKTFQKVLQIPKPITKARPVTFNRLSLVSSLSDNSIQSPSLTPRSLNDVFQPMESHQSSSHDNSEIRFAGVCELNEHFAADSTFSKLARPESIEVSVTS